MVIATPMDQGKDSAQGKCHYRIGSPLCLPLTLDWQANALNLLELFLAFVLVVFDGAFHQREMERTAQPSMLPSPEGSATVNELIRYVCSCSLLLYA